jgi:hypothetical protein
MPKKKIPQQVVHFRIKSRAKAKGERSYPTRTITVDVNTDLYNLAKVIVQAFDFDFDHAFGFFDDLKNPYQAQVRFELFGARSRKCLRICSVGGERCFVAKSLFAATTQDVVFV